ncbi:MAG: aldehyde ferredoxin oxidoreductase family protein [Nitrososphaerales archaeon]
MKAYAGRRLRVDLSRGDYCLEDISEAQLKMFLGGRGLNSATLFEEVNPNVNPLSPENVLIIGVGPLTGTICSGSNRFTVSAKSPHTGILGDANAGGFFGPEVKYAGLDQIAIKGRAPKPIYLKIFDGTVEIKDASHLWGKDVWETDLLLKEEVGDSDAKVACIGPAAENGVSYAGVVTSLVRIAARTGMGTVMASKNLKAIVVRGTKPVEVADYDEFDKIVKEIEEQIYSSPDYVGRSTMGSTRLVNPLNQLGFLVSYHFKTGVFEGADKISGETLRDHYNVKVKACGSCPLPCSRFYVIKSGRFAGLAGEGPEYETLGSIGSRCGVDDIEAILKANDKLNRYGMDSITTGEVIALAMECYERGLLTKEQLGGLDLTWGNAEAVLTLIDMIAYKKGIGEKMAYGAKKFGEFVGQGADKLAAQVKGLEIIAGEPRGMKAFALTYAVSSRGADHLRAEPMFEFSNNAELAVKRFGAKEAAFRLEYKAKGRVVKYYEECAALADSLTMCKNISAMLDGAPRYYELEEVASRLLKAAVGWDMSPRDVLQMGERIINIERAFVVREGITRKDDTLPERFLKEPLPPECGPSAGSIVELEPMLDEYYEVRGWDKKTGIPKRSTLERLDLKYVADDLASYGKLAD